MIAALRRRLRAFADIAVAVTVTVAPVLFPRSLDDPPKRERSRDGDDDPRAGA